MLATTSDEEDNTTEEDATTSDEEDNSTEEDTTTSDEEESLTWTTLCEMFTFLCRNVGCVPLSNTQIIDQLLCCNYHSVTQTFHLMATCHTTQRLSRKTDVCSTATITN